MRSVISTLMIILLAGALGGCGAMKSETASAPGAAASGEQVKEIMPGMLEGYLTKEEQLDSLKFVLPSPAEDSAQQAMDTAWADNMQALRGTDRWSWQRAMRTCIFRHRRTSSPARWASR